MTTVDCKPAAAKLPKLANLSAIYETYKILSWTVSVVHSGGNNSTGSYFLGVSYKADKHPSDLKGVASLSPVVCRSCHQDASLSVPVARLMGQPWLDNSADSPGAVMLWNDSRDNLQVWVTYRVVFNGPTSVAQTEGMDLVYKYSLTNKRWDDEAGNHILNVEIPFDAYGELEVGGTEETYLDNAWTLMSRVVRSARELHRVWSESVGLVHFVMNQASFALPVLAAPAVLHLQRRPFRTSSSEWIRLGLLSIKGEDTETGGGVSGSSTTTELCDECRKETARCKCEVNRRKQQSSPVAAVPPKRH